MISRLELQNEYSILESNLQSWGKGNGKLAVIKAPPGSGKTHTLLQVISHWVLESRMRLAVGAQTNAQAIDIANRLIREYPNTPVVHWIKSGGNIPNELDSRVIVARQKNEIPHFPSVTIATVSKFGYTETLEPFDLLAIDESWQMSWETFMATAPVSSRFLMIGDPGQIAPIVPIAPKRWETANRAPHLPAPEVVSRDPELSAQTFWGALPSCRRLPYESVAWIKSFYDFDFHPFAIPKTRGIKVSEPGVLISKIQHLLHEAAPIGLQIDTPEFGPPLELDKDIASKIIQFVNELLNGSTEISDNDDGSWRKIVPGDIGISATHRILNSHIIRELNPKYLREGLRVETPERWQGLERAVMLIAHPLSGVIKPTGFDLDPGRLCVMVSRHKSALFVFARDHLVNTLENYIPSAEQAPGKADQVGNGLNANREFWNKLNQFGRIVDIS